MNVLSAIFLLCLTLPHPAEAGNIRRRQQTKVYDPNPRCDLCGSVEGDKPQSNYVPKERVNELVDTLIAGMMPCGALEHAGLERVFTEEVCSAMKTNAGGLCCSLPPSSSLSTTMETEKEEEEKKEEEPLQEEGPTDKTNDVPVNNSETSKAEDEDEDCDDHTDKVTDVNVHDMPNPQVERTSIAEFCQRNGHNDEEAQTICENTMQRWESSSTKNIEHTNSYISWFKSVGKEASAY